MEQAGAPKAAAKSVTPIVSTCGHWLWLRKVRYKLVFD